jgi:UDP-GlcNAc:undecaprenyl-phosphate GlcNAc-1-phosphate transferase
MNFLWIGISSLIASFFISALAFKLYPKFNLMDKPHKYGHDRKPVPYSVGISLYLVFLVSSLLILEIDKSLLVLLSATTVMVVVSFMDDYLDLSPVLRLLAQLCCAGLAVWSGAEVLEFANPVGGSNFLLGGFSFVFSMLWIVLLTNLVNFLDGVSGLSSGVSSVGFFVLFGLSIWPGMHVTDQTVVSVMALILGVIAMVAAIFEFPSPKYLVGDSGAMFFGFMLGVLSLLNGGKIATVALVLLIPIFDGLWAITRRLYNKQSPFKGDLMHVHHRLLEMGISRQRLVASYYIVSILFGLIALFSWNTFFKVVSLALIFLGFSFITYFLWIQGKK